MSLTFITLITIIHFSLLSITAYGAYKRNRSWFTLGLCFFSSIPIIVESLLYAQDDALVRLPVIIMFLTQVIITLPIGVKYGANDPTALAITQKIGFAVIVANLCLGYLILSESLNNVPILFGVFHLCMATIVLYAIIRSHTSPNIRWN
jgi:predicted Kef-type K+ transport protein